MMPWARGEASTTITQRPRPPSFNTFRRELPFVQQTDHHSKTARQAEQARVGARAGKRAGLWGDFKAFMQEEYGVEPKWLESRGGSVKAVINELGSMKAFVERVMESDTDDLHVQNMLREIHGSLITALVKAAERNELKITEGGFRNFVASHIPDLDPRRAQDYAEVPPSDDDELQEEKARLTAWLQ